MRNRRKRKVFRQLSDQELLELHAACMAYGLPMCAARGVPDCYVDDVLAKAFAYARRKLEEEPEIRNMQAFAHCTVYRALVNSVTRARRWKITFSLDASTEDAESEERLTTVVLSDNGLEADRIRQMANWTERGGKKPRWLVLYRNAMSRQGEVAMKVIRALRHERCYARAMKECGFGKQRFFRNLRKIRIDFTPCFQAYREFLKNRG